MCSYKVLIHNTKIASKYNVQVGHFNVPVSENILLWWNALSGAWVVDVITHTHRRTAFGWYMLYFVFLCSHWYLFYNKKLYDSSVLWVRPLPLSTVNLWLKRCDACLWAFIWWSSWLILICLFRGLTFLVRGCFWCWSIGVTMRCTFTVDGLFLYRGTFSLVLYIYLLAWCCGTIFYMNYFLLCFFFHHYSSVWIICTEFWNNLIFMCTFVDTHTFKGEKHIFVCIERSKMKTIFVMVGEVIHTRIVSDYD